MSTFPVAMDGHMFCALVATALVLSLALILTSENLLLAQTKNGLIFYSTMRYGFYKRRMKCFQSTSTRPASRITLRSSMVTNGSVNKLRRLFTVLFLRNIADMVVLAYVV